jgi:two-component system alkaline phosphatase synthesis response regulator PhoP
MNEAILLVEDEEAVRITLGDRLTREGFFIQTAVDGQEALDKATRLPFDIIILDIMLPFKSGFDVCREIRQAGIGTPILLLSARSDTVDKVVGLKLGADDYVSKPFEAVELLARIEALLRRVPSRSGQGTYRFGEIQVDLKRGQITRDGSTVGLSGRELQLLRYLIERAGQAIPRSDILRSVWGYHAGTFTRTVDVHIASLRQKLESDTRSPQLILTVPGIGYKFAGVSEKGRAETS